MKAQPIRNPKYKIKTVTDLLISTPITSYQLKKISGKDSSTSSKNYSPLDIRRVKVALNNLDEKNELNVRPPIINVRMAKGGTGKSMVSANLASAFAMLGYKVLAIDGDPQASLTNILGVDPSDENIQHIGHLMEHFEGKRILNINEAVRPIYPDNMLDLIPADITLTQTDSWLMTRMGRDLIFDRLITNNPDFFNHYDVIVIDSAPGTTLLSYNLMAACKTILAVAWLDRESLKAMNLLFSNLLEINHVYPEKNLDVEIVANGYHPSYRHCKEALAILAESYKNAMNENVIPHYSGFVRQQSFLTEESKGPLVEQDPTSIGGRVILDLAKSLLTRYEITLLGFSENIKPLLR
ncbi:ParA family protein [Methylovulum psychrotolerans]|jgi:chromosome partitioning protein|nr:ParA family protein [Methylovulum psychrotolerans]MBT9100278.1 ParA family protein [Methylovulum psychrotolerans]